MTRKRIVFPEPTQATITALSHEGRGIAHVNGKTVFIDEALPGETVTFRYTFVKSKFAEGQAIACETPASTRVTPQCPHFGICGGCSLQHMDSTAQIQHKEQVLLQQLQHFGHVQPLNILPPLQASPWGYRHKARLSVHFASKKETLLVGFHEKYSHRTAELNSCVVLHPAIGQKIQKLRTYIEQLHAKTQIPQLEIAIGDDSTTQTAMIVRHLVPLDGHDLLHLQEFEIAESIQIYLQPKGPSTIHKLSPKDDDLLSYCLPDENLEFLFHPTDFTQINPSINRKLVALALELLDVKSTDHVLDLFCGLGNFTLPIAKRAAHVVGVEGSTNMVTRAQKNAEHNQINNAEFYTSDLLANNDNASFRTRTYDKVLLDPPRAGAEMIVQNIAQFNARRIVYVSCNPATLARDAGILVAKNNYVLQTVGVIDMFPHTQHVESIAVFDKL